MTRAKPLLMNLGVLFSLSACSPTQIAAPTASVAASATPPAAQIQSQNALPTFASSTPPVVEMPADFSPVLYGGKVYQSTFFLLLGGVSRDAWLVPYISVARFGGEAAYSLHSFTQETENSLRGQAPRFSPACGVYTVGTDAALEDSGLVGVLAGWDVTKRPVTELSADGDFYRQAVTDWLRAEGVSAPLVDSMQVYRVDLEGDGSDEVFIGATHLVDSQHTTRAGDYSIVLVRQVVGSEAVTRLVVGDIYRSQEPENTFPRTYSLANFIDLNQDGVLEVVVEIRKWEGFGARVFQIDEEDVIQTLGAEC